jgi:hypothetical protein
MKKIGFAIVGTLLALGSVFASSSDTMPGILAETTLPAISPIFAVLNSAISPAAPISIAESDLPSSNFLPLMAMDLYPTPAPAQPARDYSSMNLDPKSAVLNIPTFRPAAKISGFGDALYDVSLLSFLALNVADYISTRECLKYPGLSEGNPMMKPFVNNPYAFAAVKAGLGVVTYWTMKSLYKKSKPLAWAVSIASNLALSYVVSNNFRLLNQAKARVA